MNAQADFIGRDDDVAPAPDVGTLVAINRAEIDGQIATAHAFPRSNTKFLKEARELVTLDVDMAEACIYALPRDGKTIAGPSARFAEIIQSCYGNNRGGGRVVSEEGEFVVAQGTFHDLERNVQVAMEVRRRITDKAGRRFKADMIVVTGNAAASIAHRNAVLKGIPKALWLPLYEAARRVAVGDATTLAAARDKALEWFQKAGVSREQVLAKLGANGVEDIGIEEMETLVGMKTAIREGVSPDSLFAPDTEAGAGGTSRDAMGGIAAQVAAKRTAKPADPRKKAPEPEPEFADDGHAEMPTQEIHDAIAAADTLDALDEAADLIRSAPEDDRIALRSFYETRRDALELDGL